MKKRYPNYTELMIANDRKKRYAFNPKELESWAALFISFVAVWLVLSIGEWLFRAAFGIGIYESMGGI